MARVPTPPHHALVLGNALHQAVAAWHLGNLRGRPLDEAGILDAFDAHWSSEGFLSRHHEEARYAAGQEALSAVRHATADPTRDTVAVERSFQSAWVWMWCAVDTTGSTRRAAGAVITDYKSSDVRDQHRADERARESLQLQLYALAWEAETGALPIHMELHFLDSGLVGRVTPEPNVSIAARTPPAPAGNGIRVGSSPAKPDMVGCGYCPLSRDCPSSAA